MSAQLDQRCIDTLRFLAVDAVEKADSGHPGLPLGAMPMAYVLWDRFLRHSPQNPGWTDRDRFVLSAGHGSALQYALLYGTGYEMTLDDLKRFRQWGSRTPGHPERGMTPGVEVTTGPLGQGFANAVGLAMAEAQLAARYNRPGHTIVDHRTFVLASDGDLMEGVAAEAASLAGHLKLGKLVCLYDDNYVTLAAGTDITFTEDRGKRFEAYGWHVVHVDDGNDLDKLETAIRVACDELQRPSLVVVRTHLGYGSPQQDSYKAHGSPLGEKGVDLTKRNLGWPVEPDFLVPDDALAHLREAVERGRRLEADWNDRFAAYAREYRDLAAELEKSLHGALPDGWDADIPVFPADAKGMATREASGKVLNAIAPKLPALTGGSADLDPSTKTALKGLGDFNPPPPPGEDEQGSAGGGWSYAGRNLHFGVREHAMGAIANGMAAHFGCLPYTATFLIFSDYMRPPMRLAALSHLHVIHVFTHDSVALGEDGPTHQPIEQLAGLRAIPNLTVIRPADANETAVAWQVAIETRDAPVSLVFTRQAVPTLDRDRHASASGLRRGAYVLETDPDPSPQLVLIASGSEVHLIVEAAQRLRATGLAVRCVSMPSWELFDAQPREYRDSVLPPGVRARLAVEAGATQGWWRYVGDAGDVLGIDHFGASAPGDVNLREFGFTVDEVCRRAQALLSAAADGARR
ncbi:MAG TPA: transketolase [Xanthomonadaceae bacterium]|nr:transketolase [Xanthomonadaceae bacterium]